MAQELDLNDSFVDGQGAGAATYVTYAEDLDENFVDIENTVNQLVAEVGATLAANGLILSDILVIDDANTPLASGVQDNGVIGEHSYQVSINGGDTSQLFVEAGAAYVQNARVAIAAQATLEGTGTMGVIASTGYVAINANGALSLSETPNAQILDIASVPWTGTIFSGAVTQLAPIFFDGDDYAQTLAREATIGAEPSFAIAAFRKSHTRILALEQMLAGVATDDEGNAIGTPNLDALLADANGSAALPWLSRQGANPAGLYFPGTDRVGIATGTVLGFEVDALQQVQSPTQFRFDASRNAVQSIANTDTLTALSMDTNPVDIGTWGATTTWTVPTGGTGLYAIAFSAEFAADAAGTRHIAVTLNGAGTVFADGALQSRCFPASTGTTNLSCSAFLELTAGDVLRFEAAVAGAGGALNTTGRAGVTKLW